MRRGFRQLQKTINKQKEATRRKQHYIGQKQRNGRDKSNSNNNDDNDDDVANDIRSQSLKIDGRDGVEWWILLLRSKQMIDVHLVILV